MLRAAHVVGNARHEAEAAPSGITYAPADRPPASQPNEQRDWAQTSGAAATARARADGSTPSRRGPPAPEAGRWRAAQPATLRRASGTASRATPERRHRWRKRRGAPQTRTEVSGARPRQRRQPAHATHPARGAAARRPRRTGVPSIPPRRATARDRTCSSSSVVPQNALLLWSCRSAPSPDFSAFLRGGAS